MQIQYFKFGAKPEKENKGNCRVCNEYKELDRHHVVKRSAGGKETIGVCRVCHEWIELHPREAKEKGLWIPFYKTKHYKDNYGRKIPS